MTEQETYLDRPPYPSKGRWCRTIQRAGHGVAINLPADWASRFGFRAGDVVLITALGPHALRIEHLRVPATRSDVPPHPDHAD